MILLVEIMLIQLILHQHLPQLFEDSQNLDFLFFADAANIWGVDYNSSIKNDGIRSSIGYWS